MEEVKNITVNGTYRIVFERAAVKAITDLEVAGKTVSPELITLRNNWLLKALKG